MENVLKIFNGRDGVIRLKFSHRFRVYFSLVARTSGVMTSILETHLNSTRNWGMVRSEIINAFLPSRVKERYFALYALDRFQSSSEDLNSYTMAMVAAAEILGFEGGFPDGSPHTAKSTPSSQGSPFVRDQAGVGEGLVRPCDDRGGKGGNRRTV
jgi:hypothetical protein